MARIIKTRTSTNIGMKIINHYTDGSTSEVDLYKGDIVTNLQYVGNEEVITVTGKITDISLATIPGASKSYKDISDFIANRIMVNSVTIDHSEMYDSNVSKIPVKEILEYEPNGNEIARVSIKPIIQVALDVTLSDYTKSSIILEEGIVLSDITLLNKGGEKTIDIDVDHFVYTISPKTMTVEVSGIVTSASSDNTMIDTVIPMLTIKSCGTKTISIDTEVSLQNALNELKESGINNTIVLPSIKYKEALDITGDANIRGFYSTVPANTGMRCSDDIDSNEAIIANKIICESGANIVFQGLTITEDSLIELRDAKTVTFKNCKFVSINPTSNKTFLISGRGATASSDKVKVMIEGCYFGNNDNSSNAIYNGLEFGFQLAKGSYIKNCYFAKNCVNHNIINIYSVEDGAVIYITGNHFEYSANAIRIGTIGNAKAHIIISDNTYDETDPDEKYAGLLLIQPYLKDTISMADLRIDINNTTKPEGQLYYTYFGPNDTQMNETLWAKLYVDGVKQVLDMGNESEKDTTETVLTE